MQEFKDKNGDVWPLVLTADTVTRISAVVKDPDGKSVDIFKMVETANFTPLKHLYTLLQVGFQMVFPEVMEKFDLTDYDEKNVDLYDLIPDLKKEPKVKKAFRWFSSLFDGPAIEDLSIKIMEEIINFTSSPVRQKAIREVLEKEKELEDYTISNAAGQIVFKMDSTREKIHGLVQDQIQKAFSPLEPQES